MRNSAQLLLVGGYGFIGRNILDALNENSEFDCLNPIIIDDLSNAAPGFEAFEHTSHFGDYKDSDAIRFLNNQEEQKKGRIFVFLAGETRVAESKDRPLDFIEANIAAPSKFVMDAVKPDDHFILVSTAGALFDGSFEVSVESNYRQKNFYGATKAAEEMILEKLVELRGAQFSVVRLTNVFGKFSENKKSAIHAFTRAALSDEEITINGDGQQSRDFIYAGDVGRGIATLALRLSAGEQTQKINMLGSGTSIKLEDVVNAIETASGRSLRKRRDAAKALISTEPRDVIANKQDVKLLLGETITCFADGIAQTYAYYKSTMESS